MDVLEFNLFMVRTPCTQRNAPRVFTRICNPQTRIADIEDISYTLFVGLWGDTMLQIRHTGSFNVEKTSADRQ